MCKGKGLKFNGLVKLRPNPDYTVTQLPTLKVTPNLEPKSRQQEPDNKYEATYVFDSVKTAIMHVMQDMHSEQQTSSALNVMLHDHYMC